MPYILLPKYNLITECLSYLDSETSLKSYVFEKKKKATSRFTFVT